MGKHRDSDDEEEAPTQPSRSKDKKKGSDDEDEGKGETPVNKNKRYRKEKPWDHDGIDHWKVGLFFSSSPAICRVDVVLSSPYAGGSI